MGLDRDSIDLFHDNLSGASIFARPRIDHSSRYLDPFLLRLERSLRNCRPNERTWPFLTREISFRSDLASSSWMLVPLLVKILKR